MAEVTVASTAQADIEAAKAAAGAGGTVIFPRGTYVVDDLRADIADQQWVMKHNARLQRAPGSTKRLLRLSADLELVGGILDANNGTVPTDDPRPSAIQGVGAKFKWIGGELCNSPSWGVQMDDADLVLDGVYIHNIAWGGIHWRAMTPKSAAPSDWREGPKIRNCMIDLRVGHTNSAGILVNGGGGTSSAYRASVVNCDILLPRGETYDFVGVEYNYVDAGTIDANRFEGSRIAISSQSCYELVKGVNTGKYVSNYMVETVNGYCVSVLGNAGSGTNSGTPGIAGVIFSGSSNMNIAMGNNTRIGFPVGVAGPVAVSIGNIL